MQKFDDEKLIQEKEAQEYITEFENQKHIAKNLFDLFENKIQTQNLINIISKLLSLINEAKKLLQDLLPYITNTKQNETKVKIRTLQEQESSLKLLYNIEDIESLNLVKINQSKPLLKNAIDIICKIIKEYISLNDFEMNTKIKDVIKKYTDETLEIVFFLTDFLI